MARTANTPEIERPRRPWRRAAIIAALLAAVVAALVAVGIVFRTDVLHAVLQNRLAAMGFGDARFSVERLSGEELVITALRLDDSLYVRHLSLSYTPGELLEGRLGRVEVEGLRADLTRPNGAVWRLLGGGRNGSTEAPPPIPALSITDVSVRLPAGDGALTVAVEGTAGPISEGLLPVDFSLALQADQGKATGALKGAVQLDELDELSPGALAGSLDLRLASESLAFGVTTAEGVDVHAPLAIAFAGGVLDLELAAPATATVERVSGQNGLTVETVSATAAGNIRLAAGTVHYDMTLDLSRIVVGAGEDENTFFPLALEPARIIATGTVDAGKHEASIGVSSLGATARGRHVEAKDIDVILAFDTAAALPRMALAIGSIRQVSPESPIVPVSLSMTATPADDGARLFAEIMPQGTDVKITLSGHHDLRPAAGKADLTLAGATFQPGALQPKAIVPAMEQVKDVSGGLTATAALAWSNEAWDGTARLGLNDLSATTAAGRIDGLAGTIAFASLYPPTTPPGQRLTIRRIDTAIPMTDTTVSLSLHRDGALLLERLSAGVVGGTLNMTDQRIDPFADSIRATVEIAAVDLERLVGLLGLGDVHATGTLSGAVPLRIAGTTISIDDAHLATTGRGTLRISSEQASRVLAQGGHEVQLMLQALEDFRYESLSVHINKSPDGRAVVALRTLGNNPAVLDGRSFQINVNLETNLDRVLEAIAEWYRLSGRALRDMLGDRSR